MILSILKTFIYMFLSIWPPYLGFFLTSHIIKEYYENNRQMLINIILALALLFYYSRSFIYVMLFLSIYAIIVVGNISLKKLEIIGEFDKGIIVSILSVFCVFLIYHLNMEFINEILQQVKVNISNELTKVSNDNIKIIEEAISQAYELFFSFLFLYVFSTYILTSYLSRSSKIMNWKLSYVHLIWYIIAYILYYLNIDNIFTKNTIKIIQNIYIIYGLKEIIMYLQNHKKNKSKLLAISFGALVYVISPVIPFVYGSISSFEIFKKKH